MTVDRTQAQRLIRDTFEKSFDRGRFILFISNLLKDFEENHIAYHGQYIPHAYADYLRRYERIGIYREGRNRIDILVITLKKGTSLEHKRSMQRNFIAGYLRGEYGSTNGKEAALVAYVPEDGLDWRFSLVKLEYTLGKTKSGKISAEEEITPARRWSFLVGENEKSHTAQSRFVRMLERDERPSLSELENAFDIETVTREFFLKYRDLFIRTKEALDHVAENSPKVRDDFEAHGIDTVNFAKKLLGQIVFLYFLQKKGWFGVERASEWGTGSRHFLRELFEKKHGDYRNFFDDILEPLFYEALRRDRSSDAHYYSRFNCRIPFLNGGLFDPLGNYDWVNSDIALPNELFSNSNRTQEGDRGNGILDIFDRYNFTVKEDEPLEKEVAIDPELLGKTYEKFNAIRPDNFDEFKAALESGNRDSESRFNRTFGVYYTPREIVHYMCQQALIEHLHHEFHGGTGAVGNTALISRDDIETLIHQGEQLLENEDFVVRKGKETERYSHKIPASIREHAAMIDGSLADVTVCDPAVGSGAFPVGMMNEIVKLRTILSLFTSDAKRTVYDYKRRCIEHSLYGADIDPGAVEIAKLRLWLSLVVDETDMRNIRPLPNLDYKIICGDSLVGYPRDYEPRGLDAVEELKSQFFHETDPTKKAGLRKKIDKEIADLYVNTKANLGYQVTMDFRIDFSEVFSQKGGFDIVIANPPYIQLQSLRGNPLQETYKKQEFQVYDGNGDMYCLFYEKGMNILRRGGLLVFITSSKWTRSDYGKKLRTFFLGYDPLQLIELGPGVFESATVDTNILIVRNKSAEIQLRALSLPGAVRSSLEIGALLRDEGIPLSDLGQEPRFICTDAERRLREKIQGVGLPLKEWDVTINYGIKTGLNDAFLIDTGTRDRLVAEDPRSAEILKPISGQTICWAV